jgi:hypothetical protein
MGYKGKSPKTIKIENPDLTSLSSLVAQRAYLIDLKKWNIDGNPLNNRNGIQAAIDWAYDNHYQKVVFPYDTNHSHPEIRQGIYTLEDGNTSPYSGTNRHEMINLRSNTIYDLNGCTLKVKPNNFEGYQVVTMRLIQNTILQNGFIVGDKNEHDYSVGTTHEWGYGVRFMGATNCFVKNMDIKHMTGDAVYFGDANAGYKQVGTSLMEVGSIDDTGNAITDTMSYRTNTFIKYTDLYDSVTKTSIYAVGEKRSFTLFAASDHGYGSLGEFKIREVYFYFYDASYNFISKKLGLLSSDCEMPDNAEYIKFVFPSLEFGTFTTYQFTILREAKRSKNSYVMDSVFTNCRRQGVSISKSVNCGVKRTLISDISGTAPSACIDIEDGSHSTEKIIIEDCIFKNSKWGVIFYDGHRHSMKNCTFEKNDINISNTYATGVTIENCNVFDGTAFIGRTTNTSNGYHPLSVTVRDCLFRDCKVDFNGFANVYETTFVNVDLRAYNGNNNIFDCNVVSDMGYRFRNQILSVSLKDVKIYRTSFDLTDVVDYEIFENAELHDCTYVGDKLRLTKNVVMKRCIIETRSGVGVCFEQLVAGDFFYAEDTTFNLNSNKFAYSVMNFSLKRCTINGLDSTSNYGMAYMYSPNGVDVSVTLDECKISYPNNKRFIYWVPANGAKLVFKVNKCNIINTSTKTDLKLTTSILPADIRYLELIDTVLEGIKCDFRNEDLEEDVTYK